MKTTLKHMKYFMDNWKGGYFSECGALLLDLEKDQSLLNMEIFIHVQKSLIVFSTIEDDANGVEGSSYGAYLY